MDKPGESPFVIELDATWYMEMLKASAIQNPNKDVQVHFRSSESNATGLRSVLLLNKLSEEEVAGTFGSLRYSRRFAILKEKGELCALA